MYSVVQALAASLFTISACTASALSGGPVTINIRRPAPKVAPKPKESSAEDGSPLIIVGAGTLGCRVASLWKALEGDRAPIYVRIWDLTRALGTKTRTAHF